MLRGINKNTDDYIVEFLAEGGYSGKKIVNHLNDIKSISKQSVYERIRKLVDQKIILKIKTKYYLNNAWVDSVRQLFDSFNTPLIKEGESISYTFNNLYQLDAYWRHLFYRYNSIDPSVPAFSYDKHPFWEHLYSAEENEKKYKRLFREEKKIVFFLIGSEGRLDKEFKTRNQDDFYRINCINNNTLNDRDFVMVFGEIVITSRVPEDFMAKISDLYLSNISLTELKQETKKAIEKITKATLKIEHNKDKAQKFQKIILKDFVVSTELKKRLNL